MLERALGAEMRQHLGYAPGQAKPEGGPANRRKGKSKGKSKGIVRNCEDKIPEAPLATVLTSRVDIGCTALPPLIFYAGLQASA
ncbi:hypothetical protein AT984_19510 [Paucibacter sp. KCTC 42545]|nr:hypothetical protein AT984_19510 [Paucibacter sp. KCTC 42545]